jgi:hypothetical protein
METRTRMDYKDANKLLARALFMAGADNFERRFVATPQTLRDLFIEVLRISMPDGVFEPKRGEPGVVVGSFEGLGMSGIEISVYNLFDSLDRSDLQRSRDGVVAHVIRTVETISDALTADPDAHLRGPLIVMVGSDKKLSDYTAMLGARSSFVSWRISDNLNAMVAVEAKAGAAYLQREALPKLGLSEEQVKVEALASMKERVRKSRLQFEQVGRGIVLVDGFEGVTQALLAIDDFVQGLRDRIGEDVVVLAADDLLVVVDATKADTVGFLMGIVANDKVENLFPGSYFLVAAEGVSTLDWDDLRNALASAVASRSEPVEDHDGRSGPTFN